MYKILLTLILPITFLNADISKESVYFSSLLNQRHSGYGYENEKSVAFEDLLEIAEAVKLAPSCYNDQPWRFIFTDKEKTPEEYTKILNCLAPENQEWAKNAPVLIVASASTKFSKNLSENRWGQYDTGAAAMTLLLKASSLGLMAHEMGRFDEKLAQELFQIPEDFKPMTVIAIGYETPHTVPPIKKRNPLEANFFWGSWGSGMNSGTMA